MNLQSLNDTIRRLEEEGESLELVRLKLERINEKVRLKHINGGRGGYHGAPSIEVKVAKFWDRVKRSDSNACWPWTGCVMPFGYGRYIPIKRDRRIQTAHKFAIISSGVLVPNGMCVLHTCDNPPCCNPNHLYVGTYKQNAMDKVARGRQSRARGELCGMAKLSEDDVHFIRLSTERNARLASMFSVASGTISKIRKRQRWQHIQ